MEKEDIFVDEESFQGYVALEIPRMRSKAAPTIESNCVVSPVVEPNKKDKPEAEEVRVKSPKPQKSKTAYYRECFLVNKPPATRCQTYIDKSIYDRMKSFLPMLSPDMSVTGYINNILAHHLSHHRNEINEIYNDNFKTPL